MGFAWTVVLICAAASLTLLKSAPVPWAWAALVCASWAALLAWREGVLAASARRSADLDRIEYEPDYHRDHATLGLQPLGHLAHRGARQERAALVVAQRGLDVARRQTAGVHLDRQVLERLRPLAELGAKP